VEVPVIILFWVPGFWISLGAIVAAFIVAFWTERYETRVPRRMAKGRAA
jgi:hypothetical protein